MSNLEALSRQQLITAARASNELLKRAARRSLIDFTRYTKDDYQPAWFHNYIGSRFDEFARGEIKKLMIFMPPQHGKSELNTRRMPAYLFGLNPKLRIAVAAYNHTFASKFNRSIQRIIDSEQYKELFPDVSLNSSNVRTVSGNYLRNADEFEIVGTGGSLISVGIGGGLTGNPVDIGIIDDPYKDAMSAWSETTRENVWDWYETVFCTRLHNDSQVLITLTRWHEEDLAGKILEREGDEWEVVTLPAIAENSRQIYDIRATGEALWPDKHSLDRLLAIRKDNPTVFDSLYQQNPSPKGGVLFDQSEMKRFSIEQLRPDYDGTVAVIDVADKGDDYLCMIIARQYGYYLYVVDVIYTQEPVEVTELLVIDKLMKWNVNTCTIESNAGGRIYAMNIRRAMDRTGCVIIDKQTTANKETRIMIRSGEVKERVYLREDGSQEYEQFLKAIFSYNKKGKNKHDDAPDALTMLVEMDSDKPIFVCV